MDVEALYDYVLRSDASPGEASYIIGHIAELAAQREQALRECGRLRQALQDALGTVRRSRWEGFWRGVAVLLGLSLHEAAVAAHTAQEALGRLQLAVNRSLRGLRFLFGVVVPATWADFWWRKRCDSCGRRLRQFSMAEHCDRCAAASVRALRFRIAQLVAQLDEATGALANAWGDAEEARREREAAHDKADAQELRAEEAEAGIQRLGAELEALGGDLEDLRKDAVQGWYHAAAWKELFRRALALALHQHARAASRAEWMARVFRADQEARLARRAVSYAQESIQVLTQRLRISRGLLKAERRENRQLRWGVEVRRSLARDLRVRTQAALDAVRRGGNKP